MTPELQNLMTQAETFQRHAFFLAYSSYAAIIVCAIFSILIFWKLCQIQKQLPGGSQGQRSVSPAPVRPLAPAVAAPSGPRPPATDDSRFMPKG